MSRNHNHNSSGRRLHQGTHSRNSGGRSSHQGTPRGSSPNLARGNTTQRHRHFQIYEDPEEGQMSGGPDTDLLRPQVASGQENIFTPTRPSPRIPGGRVPLQDITPERTPLGSFPIGENATLRRPSLQALDLETLSLRDYRGSNNSNVMSTGRHRFRPGSTSVPRHASGPGPLIVFGHQNPLRGGPYRAGASINPSIPQFSQARGNSGSSLAQQFREAMGPLNAEMDLDPRVRYVNSREGVFGPANHQRPSPRVVHRAQGDAHGQENNAAAQRNQALGRTNNGPGPHEHGHSLIPNPYLHQHTPPRDLSNVAYISNNTFHNPSPREVLDLDLFSLLSFHYDLAPTPRGSSTYRSTADASDATDMDATNPLVCLLCTRREATLTFTACTHKFCPSCIMGTWWGAINRPNHWPSFVSCPFCRAEITGVVDAGNPVVALLYFVCYKSYRARQKLRSETLEMVQPPGMRPYLANMRIHFQGVV